MKYKKILITGANGQLGTVLTTALRNEFGDDSVITSDLTLGNESSHNHEVIDANDRHSLKHIVDKRNITEIYHLAAILSAKGEKSPGITWDVNMKTLLNVLDIAVELNIEKVFFPSSIAVFGSDARKSTTPQNTPLNPSTVYGISKVAGENWSRYYYNKYGLDVRSLRYPGIIGHQSLPGGGTTDYAVEIYHKAVNDEEYTCYLKKDTRLPMIYMEDAVRATLKLMLAPKSHISIRSSYNIQAMTITPEEVAMSIREWIPDFRVCFKPDARQIIAESWPHSLNDANARRDWSWKPKFLLDDVTREMLKQLSAKKL